MIYIIEESFDYYADKGYHTIYASNTIKGAQLAVEKFIEDDEKLYDYGFDDEEKIWWYKYQSS